MWYNTSRFFKKEEVIPNLTKEQAIGLFAELYQNPAFRRYLEAREQYLKDTGIEMVISGKIGDGKGLAGQLIEVRELKRRTKSAYLVTRKRHGEPLKSDQEES